MNVHYLYNELKRKEKKAFLPSFSKIEATKEQLSSLLVFVNHYKPEGYIDFTNDIISADKTVSKIYYNALLGKETDSELSILSKTIKKQELGKNIIEEFVKSFIKDNIDLCLVSAWLAAVYVNGISQRDTYYLTRVMQNSGQTFDYRSPETKIVRRYPSGALSEKTALILPSLLSATSKRYAIQSPFLVAKSLGFTGGTWDKMSSIPGFKFPKQGKETVEALNTCGISMTVTIDELCPADRKMYQLRSATGTVESLELATASIASKQLAVPANYLLMDVRTGSGAFFEDVNTAQKLGNNIKEILAQDGIKTDVILTKMEQPDGASIGNYIEVEEALYIMGAPSPVKWNEHGINIQRNRVIDFYTKIMENSTGYSVEYWKKYGERLLESGEALKAYKNILIAHNVENEVATNIVNNGFFSSLQKLGYNIETHTISSKAVGKYSNIHQRELGTIINFDFGAGQNDYTTRNNVQSGVIIHPRLHDFIDIGQALCDVVTICPPHTSTILKKDLQTISKCFDIK